MIGIKSNNRIADTIAQLYTFVCINKEQIIFPSCRIFDVPRILPTILHFSRLKEKYIFMSFVQVQISLWAVGLLPTVVTQLTKHSWPLTMEGQRARSRGTATTSLWQPSSVRSVIRCTAARETWISTSLIAILRYSDPQWNFGNTVEPRYNEVLGTMKITLLYQVSHYIRVKKQRNIKSWDQLNYLVIRGFCYIRPLYNEVPLYILYQGVRLSTLACKDFSLIPFCSVPLKSMVFSFYYIVWYNIQQEEGLGISPIFLPSLECLSLQSLIWLWGFLIRKWLLE